MSFMKKGARKDAQKIRKSVYKNMMKYLKDFTKFSEIAFKLSSLLDVKIDDTNINEFVEKLGYEPLDDMGKFLVLGELGRILETR